MSFGRSRVMGGTTGAQGSQGNQGAAGSTGSQGSQGNQGNQGTAGSQGSQGSQGNQGAGGTPPFSDDVAILADNDTPTKLLRFELVGLPVGTTVITPANVDITLPGINIANTWAATQTFGVPLVAAVGTAALPGIAWAGELDSGLYWRMTGEWGFSVLGVEQAFFTGDGLTLVNTAALLWANESRITSPDEGEFLLEGGSTFDFSWLYLGGATSAFSGIKRNGTVVEFKLGDDSAFAAIKALGITLTAGAGLNKVLTSDASGVGTWEDPADGGGSPPFSDATAILEDDATGTKLLKFDLTGLSATTRVITTPDADITLAGVNIANTWAQNQTFTTAILIGSTPDVILQRDAAGVLAQRNSTNVQALRVYNTWASATSYERLAFNADATECTIRTEKGSGGGAVRNLRISPSGELYLGSDQGVAKNVYIVSGGGGISWSLLTTGSILGNTANASITGPLGYLGLGCPEGRVQIGNTTTAGATMMIGYPTGFSFHVAAMESTTLFGWTEGASTGTRDVLLRRDAAAILALVNGAIAQTFRVYNTYTSATNYELGLFGWDTNVLKIGSEKGSGGGSARDVQIVRDATTAITIGASSLVTFAGDISLGTNARIKGGSVQIKNDETGLWNSILNMGAAGGEYISLGAGEV